MSVDITRIIRRPIVTEKTTRLKENDAYAFEVDPNANKQQIAQAVETLFKVKVQSVNTTMIKGKLCRTGKFAGFRPDWKKAYVRLEKGQTIKMLEELK